MYLSEFNSMYNSIRQLPHGDTRTAALKSLGGMSVIDENGNPVKIEVREVDGSPATTPAMSAAEIDAMIQKGIREGIKALAPKPTGYFQSTIASGTSANGVTKHFRGVDAKERAHRWGQFALASLGGNARASQWCDSNGLRIVKGAVEGTNTLGGVLVPEILEADLIDLRLQYGVARQNCHVLRMTSDTAVRPRRTGGVTAYAIGEASAITASSKAWDSVRLQARKIGVLSKMSSELNEDAVISIGDDLAGEIGWAFAKFEDDGLFLGDGTSTYAGIVGVRQRLSDLNGIDDGGGLRLASGNTWAEITTTDLTALLARVPSYARRNAKWYCSPTFADSVFLRLLLALGGATGNDIEAGGAPRFLGYPVVKCDSMPATEANSQISCLLGDMSQAATFGDRRGVSIAMATAGSVEGVDIFASDEIAIRGTERFDINVHDVGTATAAGPIVGLITAAS
jgi:HK97 family phage major capsid protein